MGDDDSTAFKQTDGDKALLAIIKPVICKAHTSPGEDGFGVLKAQSVFR